MRDQLKALVKLAEIDLSAKHLEEQLEGIPRELAERRAAVEALEALVGRQEEQLREAEGLLAKQESEITARNESLSRSRAKTGRARNMREAQAVEREIESVRRSIRDGETERDRLKEMIAQMTGMLEKPLAELSSQREELEKAEAGAEARLAAVRKERDETVAGREEWTAQVDKRIVRKYETIRRKISPAVVEISEGTCLGCRMAVPPQLAINVQLGKDIERCPHCHRFIYHTNIVDAPAKEEADPVTEVESKAAAGEASP